MKTHSKNEAIQIAKVLKALIELNKVSKILDSFIPAFLNKTIHKDDGRAYLHGNFNSTGTVSGRMSSSKVNLQQLPSSGSVYAKPIKKCFSAPKGWLLVGADYNALEARVGALLTKDTAKLDVYLYGYDSHSYNAYGYWPNKMPDIQYALTRATESTKLYKVTHDNGDITYHTETDSIVKELLNDTR
jgi:DNA polymerase I